MCKIKKILGSMLTVSLLLVVLGSGRVQTEEAELDPTRFERAILNGNFGGNEIVGGGSPGRDFPALSAVPRSDFSCHGRSPGYYADEEYGCQVFHICHTDRRKDSFLCPNGTIFHQLRLICDWWYNVDCASSDLHVDVNNDIGRVSSSRDENSRSSKPQTSFTSLSNFAQTQRPSTTPTFRTQADVNFSPTESTLSGRGFGITSPTERSNFNNQINRNRNEIRNNVGQRTTLPSTIQAPSTSQTNPRAGSSFTATPRPRVTFSTTSPRIESSQTPASQRNRTPNRIRTNVRPRTGVPLPSVTNQVNPSVSSHSARIPDHFSTQKVGVPLPSLNNRNQDQRTRVRTSKPRRITVNKRPIGTSSTSGSTTGTTSPFTIPQPPSRTTFPPRQNDIPRDSKLTTFNNIDNNGVAVLDDEKVTTQFFNIGSPRVVPSRRTGSNVGVPLPNSNRQANNINRISGNNVGVPLPETSRRTNQNNIAQGNVGAPLPQTNRRPASRVNRIRTNVGVPLPSVDSQQNANDISDNSVGVRLSSVNRLPVNRNNARTNVGVPLPQGNRQQTSRNNNARTNIGVPLPQGNRQQTNRNNNARTSFGVPLPQVNRQSINRNNNVRTNAGVSLPSVDEQPANRNNIAGSSFGVPLPPISGNKINNDVGNRIGIPLPPVNQNNNARNNFGVPLPPTNRNQNRGSRRNNIGVPLPSTNRQPNNVDNKIGVPLPSVSGRTNNRNSGARTNVGIPLPQTNTQSNRNTNNVRTSRRRLPQNNIVTQRPVNDNRGTVTFLSTLQRSRARVNRLLNNQNRVTPSVTIVRDFDDDILDDLDDLNDPFDDDRFDLDDRFDDDRFDDDRFDDDRFDDDRFDDDRFDDDRFDDDRFDDDRFDDDRFDDDRFDDDRFDDDRFDDDRFDDLDDRFDDLDDRFDNDLFDFDDEIIDDRLDRFGNAQGFNFGRRPRGSTFSTEFMETSPKNIEEDQTVAKLSIPPPSEIQLPPPPL